MTSYTVKERTLLTMILVLLHTAGAAYATDHVNATVGQLESTLQSTNCFYFTLIGVTEADPLVPGSPWFAMLGTNDSGKSAYATLLAAKVSGGKVRITSSGQLVCGFSGVTYVVLE